MSRHKVPRVKKDPATTAYFLSPNTFRPDWKEFVNFDEYVGSLEKIGAHAQGCVKIIPPKGWVARKSGYENLPPMTIVEPYCQIFSGRNGAYQKINFDQAPLSVEQFATIANSNLYRPPTCDTEGIEHAYWDNIKGVPPIYGSDVEGSLFDKSCEIWNINKLDSILSCLKKDYELETPGITSSYLYFGAYKSTFAWHTEDMELYSINYLHFGAPKTWYTVPPAYGHAFEKVANELFPMSYSNCNGHLRHKTAVISPEILRKYGIPYKKITQGPNEFVITFPFGYHGGFNNGYNCAEASNFARPRWVEYGKRALQCDCR